MRCAGEFHQALERVRTYNPLLRRADLIRILVDIRNFKVPALVRGRLAISSKDRIKFLMAVALDAVLLFYCGSLHRLQ